MHEHDHDDHTPITQAHDPSPYEKRAWAIQSLLIEKGMLSADEVRQAIEYMDSRTPALGARIVAHAWMDAPIQGTTPGRCQSGMY